MDRIREGWYEREEIQKVTLDWIKVNCKFTERERELLQIVYDRKLVRRDHLEIISPSYRHTGLHRTTLLNRAIKKMYKKMIFDKVHEAQEMGKGSSPCIVALDKAGSLMLRVSHKKRIIHKRTTFKGQYYISRSLPNNFRHINGVNQTEVDTILFCEETKSEIIKWKHEVATKFYHSGEEILFIPDVLCELSVNGKQLLLFIEYDTGTENLRYKTNFPIINEKINKYKKYRASKLWETEFPLFPILLLVTEDDKRIQYFNQKCKEMGLRGFGVFYLNYGQFLSKLAKMTIAKT
jgi:hypothetical protein